MKKYLFILMTICFIYTTSNSIYAKEKENEQIYEIIRNIDNLNLELKQIKSNQISIINNLTNDSINLKKEIGLPVFLSVIAGIIFWIIFQLIPAQKRKNKLRPKIEKDLLKISSTIIHMVQLTMLHNENTVSLFYEEISSGQITKELIETGLYNKALNKDHLVGNFSNNIVIGKKIYDYAREIEERIERIFYFNEQLDTKEILILDDIYQTLKTYGLSDYDSKYEFMVGGFTFKPENPSLSYMSDFFFNINKLRQELDTIIISSKKLNRELLFKKISHLKNEKKYKPAIKLIKRNIKYYKSDSNLLMWYLFDITYIIDKNNSLKILENLVNKDTCLVSSRGFLHNRVDDEQLIDILKRRSTDEKIQQLKDTIKREESIKDLLLENNTKLKESLNS
ncbi:hypothetical protein ACU9QV_003075 [Acinetobacter baumannii]